MEVIALVYRPTRDLDRDQLGPGVITLPCQVFAHRVQVKVARERDYPACGRVREIPEEGYPATDSVKEVRGRVGIRVIEERSPSGNRTCPIGSTTWTRIGEIVSGPTSSGKDPTAT